MSTSAHQANKGMLSNEYVNESTDEGSDGDNSQAVEDDSQSSATEGSRLVNGAQNSNPSTTSGSQEASDNDSDETAGSSEAQESKISDSNDDSGLRSPESSKNINKRKAIAAVGKENSKHKKLKSVPVSSAEINPLPFIAPVGFETIKTASSDYTSDAGNMFANLSDKQIWHFSAPEDFSIQAVTMLDIQEALNGAPILRKNDIDYIMQTHPAKKERLLLNHGSGDAYKQSTLQVTRSFQLRESTKEQPSTAQDNSDSPETNGDEILKFSATIPGKKKTPRIQPGGLKMRWVPYGSCPRSSSPQDAANRVFHVPDEIGKSGFAEVGKVKTSKTREKGDLHKKKMVNRSQATPEPSKENATTSSPESHAKPVEAKTVERKRKKKARLADEAVVKKI